MGRFGVRQSRTTSNKICKNGTCFFVSDLEIKNSAYSKIKKFIETEEFENRKLNKIWAYSVVKKDGKITIIPKYLGGRK